MLRTRNFLNLISVSILVLAFLSCKHTDKRDEKIVGLWSAEAVMDGENATEYFQFNDDGTFVRVCDIHNPAIAGFRVDGTWKIISLRGKMKLTYDLSSLKSFNLADGTTDPEKSRSMLRIASEDIREATGKGPVDLEFKDSGDELILTFPGLGVKKFSKEKDTDLNMLLKSTPSEDVTQAKPEEQPQSKPKVETTSGSSILRDGLNILDGEFRFQGNDYGFIVTFMYDAATGRASDATYEAAGYGGQSKLSNITVANGEKSLTLSGTASGTKTSIVVDYAGNSKYKGKMVRGANNGTCVLTLH